MYNRGAYIALRTDDGRKKQYIPRFLHSKLGPPDCCTPQVRSGVTYTYVAGASTPSPQGSAPCICLLSREDLIQLFLPSSTRVVKRFTLERRFFMSYVHTSRSLPQLFLFRRTFRLFCCCCWCHLAMSTFRSAEGPLFGSEPSYIPGIYLLPGIRFGPPHFCSGNRDSNANHRMRVEMTK